MTKLFGIDLYLSNCCLSASGGLSIEAFRVHRSFSSISRKFTIPSAPSLFRLHARSGAPAGIERRSCVRITERPKKVRGSLGFVPVPRSCRCALEPTGQRTGREYRTLTFLPALLSLLQFTRARLFRMPRCAVATMASIEVQTVHGGRRSHARIRAFFRGRIALCCPTEGLVLGYFIDFSMVAEVGVEPTRRVNFARF